MPTQSNQSIANRDFLDFDAFQPDSKRKQSPSRRNQGKNRRKHERPGEEIHSNSPTETQDQEITSRSSIPTRTRGSPFASQTDLTSKLDPSLESLDDSSKRPFAKVSPNANNVPTHTLSNDHKHFLSNQSNIAGSPPQQDRYKGNFSPSTSPRIAHRGIVPHSQSYKGGGGLYGASPPHPNLYSTYSHNGPRPPLPHLDQPHFYGAPELDFGQNTRTQSKESPRAGFCAFDRIPTITPGGAVSHYEVLLMSRGNSLDVHQLYPTRLNHIGTLKNLRGWVVDAKLVSGVLSGVPMSDLKVYAVVVVHGPATTSDERSENVNSSGGPEDFNVSQSMMQALETASQTEFQTTVDVYDLTDARHVTTLFASQKESHEYVGDMAGGITISPIGKLSIRVIGQSITVCSGLSGEVFIFRYETPSVEELQPTFKCIGKTWTTISGKKGRSHSVSSRESGRTHIDDDYVGLEDVAVAALSARFLATVSPSPSKQTTCHGQVVGIDGKKIPGLSSHAPPERPNITCQIDTPNTESLLNRVARDATQEIVKGARWVGSQSVLAWNKYWTKPTSAESYNPTGTSPALDAQTQFPPTHAPENTNDIVRSGPALISILDLEKLSQSQHQKEQIALQPVAIFSLQDGCSAMSFSPQGTQLFTASAKGDVQQVWDLMHMVSDETVQRWRGEEKFRSPMIREVAKFTRITEARIMDIAWLHPNGEKFAVATENGTVHTYELAPSTFYWPPQRRAGRSSGTATAEERLKDTKAIEQSNSEGGSSVGLGSAFGIISRGTQPLFSAVRGRTAGPGSAFPTFGTITSSAGAGAKGGKAVAAGINRSLTAATSGTINTIRHFGENRITLPGWSRARMSRCMSWIRTAEETSLAVIASGTVRIHSIRRGGLSRDGKRRPSVVGSKPTELTIQDQYQRPNQVQATSSDGTPQSFWVPSHARPTSSLENTDPNPLSYAEIETHAPYQPFHTDRRVGFCVYNDTVLGADPHHLDSDEAWAFGEVIPSVRIPSLPAPSLEEDTDDGQLQPFEMENIVQKQDDEEGHQILVTTRRKKHRKADTGLETEDRDFFEDDLEVVDFAHNRV